MAFDIPFCRTNIGQKMSFFVPKIQNKLSSGIKTAATSFFHTWLEKINS